MAAKQAKYIRNLQKVSVRVRFSSRTDPFHFVLAPRGVRNDTTLVPADLLEHPDNVRNLEVGTYEYITKAEKDKIEYPNPYRGAGQVQAEGPQFVPGVSRQQEVRSSTRAVDSKGFVQNPHDGANVNENVAPRRAAVPGSEDFGSPEKYLKDGVVKRKRGDG